MENCENIANMIENKRKVYKTNSKKEKIISSFLINWTYFLLSLFLLTSGDRINNFLQFGRENSIYLIKNHQNYIKFAIFV